MNYVTVNRDATAQFVRQINDEPFDPKFKYVPLPVLTTGVTEIIEVDVLEDAKNLLQKAVEDTKLQKPDDERQNRTCVIHGLNGNCIAQIMSINCDRCRTCRVNHVVEKWERRAPTAPPGLDPIASLKDTYDAERNLGMFINLVNLERPDSQSLANYGEVAQRPSYARSLFGCFDATHPEYRGFRPNVEYNMLQGFQRTWLSKNLVKCLYHY